MEIKPMSYVERLEFVQRIARSAQFRHDVQVAVREVCEAISEAAGALLEREKARTALLEGAKDETAGQIEGPSPAAPTQDKTLKR